MCRRTKSSRRAGQPAPGDRGLGRSAWIRPLKAFHTEMWVHYGAALLVLGIYLAGWVSDTHIGTLQGVSLGAAAGCLIALVLMLGYRVDDDPKSGKLAVIERWSVTLRGIYLFSRALAIGLYRSPWPGVAGLGGSVVATIVAFQVVQGIYLQARLLHA